MGNDEDNLRLQVERKYIERYIDEGFVVRNAQHNSQSENDQPITKSKYTIDKIKITIDKSKQCYEVRCQKKKIEKCDQVRRFRWNHPSQAEAFKKAEAWRLELFKKYF